ncbi:MAG: class I tRNA ligase family protein, partial [Firmicutes bacterium]|nr:class I tRNA ligase family protein [Bacillota bacterium]
FMPFVTEELWQSLPHEGPSIMVAPWPQVETPPDLEAERLVERVMAAIRTARNLRAELGLAPQTTVPRAVLVSDDPAVRGAWSAMEAEIRELLRVDHLEVVASGRVSQAIAGVTEGGTVYLPLAGVVDPERERERLRKAQKEFAAELDRIERRLQDANFLQRAPGEVVEQTKQRQQELQNKLRRVAERMEDLA